MRRNKAVEYVGERWDDVLYWASSGSVAYGFGLIHTAAGWISAGVAGFAFIYLAARITAQNGNTHQSVEPERVARESEPSVN